MDENFGYAAAPKPCRVTQQKTRFFTQRAATVMVSSFVIMTLILSGIALWLFGAPTTEAGEQSAGIAPTNIVMDMFDEFPWLWVAAGAVAGLFLVLLIVLIKKLMRKKPSTDESTEDIDVEDEQESEDSMEESQEEPEEVEQLEQPDEEQQPEEPQELEQPQDKKKKKKEKKEKKKKKKDKEPEEFEEQEGQVEEGQVEEGEDPKAKARAAFQKATKDLKEAMACAQTKGEEPETMELIKKAGESIDEAAKAINECQKDKDTKEEY